MKRRTIGRRGLQKPHLGDGGAWRASAAPRTRTTRVSLLKGDGECLETDMLDTAGGWLGFPDPGFGPVLDATVGACWLSPAAGPLRPPSAMPVPLGGAAAWSCRPAWVWGGRQEVRRRAARGLRARFLLASSTSRSPCLEHVFSMGKSRLRPGCVARGFASQALRPERFPSSPHTDPGSTDFCSDRRGASGTRDSLVHRLGRPRIWLSL